MITPLTRLTGNILWRWKELKQETFKKLKKLFTIESILTQFNYDRKTVIKCDSSGHTIKKILSQYDNKRFLRPCVYFSKKNFLIKCNYKIHNKELLVVIQYFKKWDVEL